MLKRSFSGFVVAGLLVAGLFFCAPSRLASADTVWTGDIVVSDDNLEPKADDKKKENEERSEDNQAWLMALDTDANKQGGHEQE